MPNSDVDFIWKSLLKKITKNIYTQVLFFESLGVQISVKRHTVVLLLIVSTCDYNNTCLSTKETLDSLHLRRVENSPEFCENIIYI